MQVAVYTIALNEEKHVPQFLQSCRSADFIVVGDTGSTDATAQMLRDGGATVIPCFVDPWRFDTPRNAVLAAVPSHVDMCISLDLDETLPRNWRELLEANWQPDVQRVRFRYVHNFTSTGQPGTVGMKDFIHHRRNYMWRHRVHETLYYVGPTAERTLTLPELVVEHRQDPRKSRDNYFSLLVTECQDPQTTPRHVFWLGREYVYRKDWNKVIETFQRFLDMPGTWTVERAHACRNIAKAMGELKKDSLTWYLRAIELAPAEREMWMGLAWYYHANAKHAQAYGAVLEALNITARPEHYLTSQDAWNHRPHLLAAECADKLDAKVAGIAHLAAAIRLDKRSLTHPLVNKWKVTI